MTHLTRLLFMTLFGVATLMGCAGNSGSPEPAAPAISESTQGHHEFDIHGKVVFTDLEGGFFAIEGNDGHTYDPINLPAPFQKDGLKVKITARKRTDISSIHMRGTIIEIIGISTE
ncbi:hypothetical protein [Desulfoluna spongiiphila]|uniref:hypothetical protein n=1 Tax=Desulfoluna spongiiphila TaxID=419481 RepID=UPI00125BCF50|nr:hypothetical protein [Desulfoluna spongiiphila]VVS91280.1 hypothetical protein DBB_8480 [Desulfoluna spongiiphila]